MLASGRGVNMTGNNRKTSIKRRHGLARAAHVLVLVLLVSAGSAGLGQQSPCTVSVNVLTPDLSSFPKADADRALGAWKEFRGWERPTRGWDAPDFVTLGFVIVPFWTVERGLPAGAFLARDKKRPVSIESVGIDRGPRRIAFIADNGKEMVAYGRKVETAVMAEILSKARAEDSFALLTVRGPRVALRFGSSRESVQAAADTLANPPQGKPDKESALEGILEAASWLQPPQPGDSIILISVLTDSKHNASFTKVRRAVATGRVRVFDIPLGGNVPPPLFIPDEGGDNSPRDMYALVRASGGVQLESRSLEQLRDNAEQMYNAIAEYYVLQVSSIGPHLNISLSPEFQKRLPMVMFLYPWNLPPCSRQSTTKRVAQSLCR